MNALPDDFARCSGVSFLGMWRDACKLCLRRIAPESGRRTVYMEPPPEMVTWTNKECRYRIEADDGVDQESKA